jgi:hypothetical protein
MNQKSSSEFEDFQDIISGIIEIALIALKFLGFTSDVDYKGKTSSLRIK